MTLFNPSGLLWGILAVPIVALYLWRVRPRRRSVPAGFLWDRVFSTDRARGAWWRWRRPVSLAVELAILALLVFALAEPLVRRPRTFVLVLDNSASMNATDVAPTRLDRAKESARPWIAALADRDQMAILSAGGSPAMHCGTTSSQAVLERALEAVPATRGGTCVHGAVALARRLLAGSREGRVLVLSDGCFGGSVDLAAAGDVDFTPVGTAAGNVTVSELAARRSLRDPSRCEILVRVSSYGDAPVACRVEVELEGERIVDVPAHLPAGGHWQRMFEITTAAGGRISARLDRPDALTDDNGVSTPLLQAASPILIASLLPWVEPPDGRTGASWTEAWPAAAWPARAESDLRVPAQLAASRPKPRAAEAAALWLYPAAAALVLVVFQWCLSQRRWVY